MNALKELEKLAKEIEQNNKIQGFTLYKHPASHYSDWNTYIKETKQSGRYATDTLICNNPQCIRKGKGISEEEAFYLFAKQTLLKRIKSSLISLYICPFCHKSKFIEPFLGELDNERV